MNRPVLLERHEGLADREDHPEHLVERHGPLRGALGERGPRRVLQDHHQIAPKLPLERGRDPVVNARDVPDSNEPRVVDRAT